MAKQHGDSRNIRVLHFLDAYEKQDVLWNSSLESYKNKTARDDAYMQIIKELNVPTLTIHDVKLKVKSIRTTYTKELRLLIKHKESGKPYNPKLFWFNRANAFLKDVSLSREKRSTSSASGKAKSYTLGYIVDHPTSKISVTEPVEQISNVEDVGNASSSTFDSKVLHAATSMEPQIQPDFDESQAPAQVEVDVTSTKNFTHPSEEFHPTVTTTMINSKLIDSATTEINTSSSSNVVIQTQPNVMNSGSTVDDDYDLFCRSVAAQLRRITDTYSRSVAKLKIQQILFEAETGYYRNNPCITIPVQQNTI